MRLEDYPKEPRFAAKVLKSERITDEGADAEVRELVFEVNRDEFNFEIGQSIGVLVEGPKEFGGSLRQRLYTVADTPSAKGDTKPQITLVVRRCDYIDDYSGEQYAGVNSNFLCDRKPGDQLFITGPFGLPFTVPEDKKADLLLIGLGTGIAPFRAFLLYMNDKRDDFARYYDEDTFEAIRALSPRPNWADPIAWDYATEERSGEILSMLDDEHTYVYVAGLVLIRDALDKLFANMVGSPESWAKRKAELKEAGRWVELLY